ncbi:MAG TPA: heparan-alpha-glucosaminide N-acetyltransferase domain-containing protein [Pelobium sp.]|nr:heparan-alpha-glucosaminide N-acetyltransferase domain-containing protein [Pelobium sp.]
MQNAEILKQRLLSLDFFRGLTVAAMILVNNPGDWGHIYSPFRHASWDGCTPTDLIFPFFLFIVGVSIVFAMDTAKRNSENHGRLLKSITKRAIILFTLGLILALFPFFNFSEVRIPGVLQRIAVVYFVCAVLFVKVNQLTLFRLFIAFILVYWLMMVLIPVPDFGAANLEKGTNLAAYVDQLVFGEAHVWKVSKTWDPEGLLSTLPAFSTGLFGVLMGFILKSAKRTQENKVIWLFVYGFLAVLLGLFWDLFFPINKSLWSSSFVLYTGGIASMFLALCYWLIDVQGFTKFTKPFVVYGVNAITVFFMSGIIARSISLIKITSNNQEITLKGYIYETAFTPFFTPYNASLAFAFAFVMFWFLILWYMYKKNIIIKV